MSAAPAIVATGLRKRYRVGRTGGYRVLSEAITRAASAPFRRLAGRAGSAPGEHVWALDGVSFEIQPGAIVGIIGRNGAGKSTLLKVLSRITEPTEGEAELRGRVGSLLEVGTGFHPELTGRENVFLNGAILGMRKGEIASKLDEIVEFAGVGRFLDTPLKRYSSGMVVRLGFSVAAFLEPEIMIVDEVLSVGDVAFQERCLGKMEQVAGGGRTVLFVSHNMPAVARLCPESIWLDAGRVVERGSSAGVIQRYVEASRAGMASLGARAERIGTGALRIQSATVLGADGDPVDAVTSGEETRFAIEYERAPDADLAGASFNVRLSAGGGRGLLTLISDVAGADLGHLPERGRIVCSVPELPLAPGLYDLEFTCLIDREVVDKLRDAGSLVVTAGDFYGTGKLPRDIDYYGPVLVHSEWAVEARERA